MLLCAGSDGSAAHQLAACRGAVQLQHLAAGDRDQRRCVVVALQAKRAKELCTCVTVLAEGVMGC